MGWGRMLLLGDVGQQLDIRDTQAALGEISAQLRATGKFDHEVAQRLDRLATENAELKLYLAAITRLLVDRGVISADELARVVDRVDREDGRADRRYDGPISPG